MPGDYHSFREWVITNLDPSDYGTLNDYLQDVAMHTNFKVTRHEEGWLAGQYVLHQTNKEEAEKAEREERKAAEQAKKVKHLVRQAKPPIPRQSKRAAKKQRARERERERNSRLAYQAQQRIGEEIHAVPIPAEFFA